MTIPAIKKNPKLIYVVVDELGDVMDYTFQWESDAQQFINEIIQEENCDQRGYPLVESDESLQAIGEMQGFKIIETTLN